MSFRFVNIAHLSENVFTSVLHTRITLDDTDQMQTVTFYSPLVWTPGCSEQQSECMMWVMKIIQCIY